MSTGAVRGDDAVAFYAAKLGPTTLLASGVAAAQTPDADGALVPGRYLVQIANIVGAGVTWIKMVPFVKGQTETLAVGVPAFPMQAGGVTSFTVNVLLNVNDRVVSVTSAGTSNVYLTRISRDA
jgi:hypothetical protein